MPLVHAVQMSVQDGRGPLPSSHKRRTKRTPQDRAYKYVAMLCTQYTAVQLQLGRSVSCDPGCVQAVIIKCLLHPLKPVGNYMYHLL
jgi:hypothetical protein